MGHPQHFGRPARTSKRSSSSGDSAMNDIKATQILARSRTVSSSSQTSAETEQREEDEYLGAQAARAALRRPQAQGPPQQFRPPPLSDSQSRRTRKSPVTHRATGPEGSDAEAGGCGPARTRSLSRARARLGPYQLPEEESTLVDGPQRGGRRQPRIGTTRPSEAQGPFASHDGRSDGRRASLELGKGKRPQDEPGAGRRVRGGAGRPV